VQPQPTIRDLLADRSRHGFVGRERELALLNTLLDDAGPLVLHVRGAPGVGKSRLLDVFAAGARDLGATVVRLDGHAIEPTEAGFRHALASALSGSPRPAQLAERGSQAQFWTGTDGRVVVAIDGYEDLRLLDTWLRQVFVPSLPATARVLLVSREQPVGRWLSAPEWSGLFQSTVVEPLPPPAALELLAQAGIPLESAGRMNAVTGGHPLALTLAAAAAHERPNLSLAATELEGVLEQLSREYLAQVPDPLAQQTLVACSVVRRITLPLLRALLPEVDAETAHARLRSLAVVAETPDGLAVQEVLRHALAAHLKSSDPARYRDYRRAAWRYLRSATASAARADLWRFTADMLYLIEDPVVRQTFFPQGVASYAVEPAQPQDAPNICSIVAEHEGPSARQALQHWWRRLPEAFSVVRDRDGGIVGMACVFESSLADEADLYADSVIGEWCDHLRRDPIGAEERALFVRAHLGRAAGASPSPELSAMVLDLKRAYMELRPRLRRVYTLFYPHTPMFTFLSRVGFRPLPGASVTQDGPHAYQPMVLDLGPGSVDGWLAELVANELSVADGVHLDRAARELLVDERRVALTPLEFMVMQYLVDREGQAVSRTDLLDDVWHDSYQGGSNVVDVVVRSLRKKLGPRASAIETVSRLGYRYRSSTAVIVPS
jgi:DNA-binding response OmpR family regulator